MDSDHANKVVTRRSHTRVLRFVQNALILSHCKVQNTVEPATFRSELVSTRLARDFIGLWIARRLKLCMFGIPITNFFCDRDNEGVVKNTIMPKSTLNKKHNPSIFMLFVNLLHRESCNHASRQEPTGGDEYGRCTVTDDCTVQTKEENVPDDDK